jgi:hypothetical protein
VGAIGFLKVLGFYNVLGNSPPGRLSSPLDERNFESYTNEYTNWRDHKRVASTISNYKIYMKIEPEKFQTSEPQFGLQNDT